MLTIIRKEIKLLLKERSVFVRLFLMPMIFIVIFSSAGANGATRLVPGFMVMFSFYAMFFMLGGFFKERDSGILARLRSTPLKSSHYLAGMWVTNILLSVVQCAVLLGFGFFMYGLNLGNLPALAVLVCALSACVTGVGIALSFLVSSEQQGVVIVQLITVGGAFISGLLLSFNTLPKAVQDIGYFMPQHWAQAALQNIMLQGAGIGAVLIEIVILLAFGFAGLGIALLRFKHFIRSATA